MMYGSLYIPLLFLERAPIDVFQTDKMKKITVNLLPTFNFSFVFQKNQVFCKRRVMHLNTFMRVLFNENEYYKSLIENKIITACEFKTFKEAKEALDGVNGQDLLGHTLHVDWAFVKGALKRSTTNGNTTRRQVAGTGRTTYQRH